MRGLLTLVLAIAAILFAVNQSAAGVLDASWTAPTTNSDGSPLNDLGLYRVYYSTSSSPCPGATFFTVATSTSAPPANQTVNFRLTGLTTASTYSVAVTAVDTDGNESACSDAANAVAQDVSAVTPTDSVAPTDTVTSTDSVTPTDTVTPTDNVTPAPTASDTKARRWGWYR